MAPSFKVPALPGRGDTQNFFPPIGLFFCFCLYVPSDSWMFGKGRGTKLYLILIRQLNTCFTIKGTSMPHYVKRKSLLQLSVFFIVRMTFTVFFLLRLRKFKKLKSPNHQWKCDGEGWWVSFLLWNSVLKSSGECFVFFHPYQQGKKNKAKNVQNPEC